MELQFKGANCLLLTTKKAKLVVDDNLANVGLKAVADKSDIALYSQLMLKPEKDPKDSFVIDGPGEYEISEISIHGIPARAHMDEEGQHSATIFRVATAGLMVVFLGHIYPELSEEQLEQIGVVDVVVAPVGGNGYTLDATGAVKLIKAIEPKIVIPTHYAESGVKYEVPQAEVEQFYKELGAGDPESVEKVKLKSGTLPEVLTTYQLKKS